MPLILIRKETSTADAEMMPYVDGLLTSTGGVTSHASVLAKKFDLVAVVGCSEMEVNEET
jgi:pyruvate,orthophosphate dikinase